MGSGILFNCLVVPEKRQFAEANITLSTERHHCNLPLSPHSGDKSPLQAFFAFELHSEHVKNRIVVLNVAADLSP